MYEALNGMKQAKLRSFPEEIRREIKQARTAKGWSQLRLGRKAGLAQRHISGIETGKIVPRHDTLLDLLRVLDRDLVLVPRELVPAIRALVRDFRNRDNPSLDQDRPLYAVDDDEDEHG
jgi:transcriptional regulator with XRE-family HTH domain